MIFYRIICWWKKDHNYSKEIMVDEKTTRNYCKCGKWLEFDWSYVGSYRKAMSDLHNIKRKKEWN